MDRRRNEPTPLKVTRSRRQNVARAPELVNDMSYAGNTATRGGSTTEIFAAL
jgi:hypothetical protein